MVLHNQRIAVPVGLQAVGLDDSGQIQVFDDRVLIANARVR